ncbi:3-hydroxyacyl-CoA dehydrogenase [Rhodococcus spelaei]|uniref:3-hydroxyacyl-CoA dehydrogenase n=1 Tax=Rhodococcus spelaei TaxID=2546320 RepID=A0A541AZZ3_9NOCA|nr:3-hydroxyacyl-CoA dehydrogenase [Rhodococcus spelaei]TQF65614.1 3-hydroxyacyl-CoA dehydrogenase [Rhodococcus spelaei]
MNQKRAGVTVNRLRVIGAGAMGRGIAQVAVTAGIEVELTDAVDSAVGAGIDFVCAMIRRSSDKGQRTVAEAEAAIARLHAGRAPTAPGDDLDLVIEAVVENLEVKRSIFADLEATVPNALLASNTSSLSITAIASVLDRPERLVGLHFFNPVPLMKLVEIVPGLRTGAETVSAARQLVDRFGYTGVLAKDTPGFLVNHLGRGLPTEALQLLSETVAEPVDIDRIARDTVGLKMGPFELMDLTGLDVSHPVLETVYAGFYGDPRLRPSPITATRLSGKMLGRKTGAGFYRYDGGTQQVPGETAIDADPAAIVVYVQEDARLADLLRSSGVRVLTEPTDHAVSIVSPVGTPTYRAALAAGVNPAHTIGVDPLSVPGPRLTVVVPAMLDPTVGAAAMRVLAATGRRVTVTADGPAPVAQRLIASIVNVGSAIAETGLGDAADIDLGARLGLGYPRGPLELGDLHGAALVVRILDGLLDYTGDPRYRASTWLRARAELGMSLRDRGTRPADLFDGR